MKDIDSIVASLLDSYRVNPIMTNFQEIELPSRACVTDLTHQLESLIYPGLVDCLKDPSHLQYSVGYRITRAVSEMNRLVAVCLKFAASCPTCRMAPPDDGIPLEERARTVTHEFFEQLPAIRATLSVDLRAAYKGDPAAKSYAEIILSYPGLRALAIHRLAHLLVNAGVPILPRMMSEFVHNRTGIDIHPGAQIGEGLFIDHGTGVVIGETSVIGRNVKIYQGVTLGALSIPDPDLEQHVKRHPTIEDDVTIYSGASILGGQTTVGARSVIGANVWLTHSVPPGTKVLYVPPELRFKSLEP